MLIPEKCTEYHRNQRNSHVICFWFAVIVMRMKRNPEPMRSFSFSGFNPNGQMAAFTGAAEYPGMFGNYGPPPQAGPYNYGPPTQDSYGPPTQDSYGPQPTGIAEQQVADPSKNKPEYGAADSRPEYGPSKPVAPAASDSNEQSNNGVKQTTNNKKQYEGECRAPRRYRTAAHQRS